jgi:hypothetical protein
MSSTSSTKDKRIGLSRLKLLSSRRYDVCRAVDWEHIDSAFRDISLLKDTDDTGTYSVDVNQHKPVVRNDDIDATAADDDDDDHIRNYNLDLDNGTDDVNSRLLNDRDDNDDPHYGNMEDNHSIRSRYGVIDDDSNISATNIPSIPFVLSIQYYYNDNKDSSRSLQIHSAIESLLKDNYAKQMSTILNSTAANNDNADNGNTIKDDDNNNNHHTTSLNSYSNVSNDITSYVECSHCNSMEIIHIKKLTELSSWRRTIMSRVKKQI